MSEKGIGSASNARRRLNWYDLRDAGHAQVALLRALARVRTQAVGTLVSPFHTRALSGSGPDESLAGQPSSVVERASRRTAIQRLELAIARAARRGIFRPSCLVRSLALADLLARRGVAGAEIRVGVRHPGEGVASPGESGPQLEAHAWVELDGVVLGDDYRRAHSFTPLGGVRVVQQPTDRRR